MSGYSEGGASLHKKTLKTWLPISLSAKSDIDYNLFTLRNRSRDLARNSALGSAIVQTFVSNVVGSGLKLFPRPDAKFLNLTPEAARDWSRSVKREFEVWTEGCDYLRRNNFYELQSIAFESSLVDGDCFVLIKRRGKPYSLKIQLIESGRVSNPGGGTFESLYKKNRVVNGIEVDGEGILTACHISNRLWNEPDAVDASLTWQRVEFFGRETGCRNVLQICRDGRPDQFRGTPILAPVIECLKQIDRYADAELTASIIRSFFSLFFTKDKKDYGLNDLTRADDDDFDISEIKVGAGTINDLPPGVDVKSVEAQNSQKVFDSFMTHFIKQVGAAVNLPFEVLLKNFQSSYSASRAALLQASSEFNRRKAAFVRDFCQPLYEQFLLEAVATGRIEAAGFEDLVKRQAWSRAGWFTQTSRILDPMRETNAMILRLNNGLSTFEREISEATGEDFNETIEILKQERELMR